MVGSAIRELVISPDSRWLAAGFFEDIFQLWDLGLRCRVADFNAAFAAGAGTLVFHPNSGSCISGNAWTRRLESYEVPSGQLLWRAKLPFFPAVSATPIWESSFG